MKTIKVAEAEGPVLDWLVAKVEDFTPFTDGISWIIEVAGAYRQVPRYSEDWAHGGPLFSEERIESYWHPVLECWAAIHNGNLRCGPTELIAKARCLVASKLGDEVEVPEELV